jgi:hypothetical protein
LVFAKKLAGEETNRQKEMRFDDQHVTNGLSESRSPFFLCALACTLFTLSATLCRSFDSVAAGCLYNIAYQMSTSYFYCLCGGLAF